jgi:hypothetical protein
MLALIPIFAAAVFPPVITKSFTPSTVNVNQTSLMTITIVNPNTSDLTGASMNDPFPPPLINVGPATSTCGSVSLTPPPTPITLFFSGTLPANSTCTITVLVSSITPGSFENLTGSVFSTGPASLTRGDAILNVSATIPAFSPCALAALALVLAALGWATSSSSS